jgi:hypothetical protein
VVSDTKREGRAVLLKKPEVRRSGEAEKDLAGERGGDCGLIGRSQGLPFRFFIESRQLQETKFCFVFLPNPANCRKRNFGRNFAKFR